MWRECRLHQIDKALLDFAVENFRACARQDAGKHNPDGYSQRRSDNRHCYEARVLVLSALEAVDYLTVFDEATPLEVIRAVRPDVLVKGADYRREQVVGGDFVESYGGRVHLAVLRDGYSTTGLLQRLGAA